MTQALSDAVPLQEMSCAAVVPEDDAQVAAEGTARDPGSKTEALLLSDMAHGKSPSGTQPEGIQALPPPPANLAGSSSASGKNFNITVSNKAGYMCHVHVEATWPVSPEVPFAIFTHPDNSALFRDVKRVGSRKVLKTEPSYKEVQVEQLGDIQVLWIRRTYSTWLQVVEDARDPECLIITFELLKSDVLGRFSGRWELRPVRDPGTGRVVGCRGQLTQDVLPKGMPSFMARLPVLGGALRGISVHAVTRVLEDFDVAMEKVRAGHAAGRSTETVLRELCGAVSEAAHANGAVTSFAFDLADGEEEEEDEEGGGAAEGQVMGDRDVKAESGDAAVEAPEGDVKAGRAPGGGQASEPAVVSAADAGATEAVKVVTVVATATAGAVNAE